MSAALVFTRTLYVVDLVEATAHAEFYIYRRSRDRRSPPGVDQVYGHHVSSITSNLYGLIPRLPKANPRLTFILSFPIFELVDLMQELDES